MMEQDSMFILARLVEHLGAESDLLKARAETEDGPMTAFLLVRAQALNDTARCLAKVLGGVYHRTETTNNMKEGG